MKKNILITFLIFLVLLLFKTFYSYKVAARTYGWGGLLLNQRKIDKFFIGSSHTRQSYNIKTIESDCHCNSYLFAYSGLGPSLIYVVLDYMINNGIKPKEIIVEAYPFKLLFSPKMHDDRFFHFAPFEVKKKILSSLILNSEDSLKFSDYVNLFLTGRNETLALSLFTRKLVEGYSYKGSYQHKIMKGVDYKEFNSFIDIFRKHIPKKEIKVNILESYLKIGRLLTKNGIKFSFVDPPLPYAIRNSPVMRMTQNVLKSSLQKNGYSYVAPWDGLIDLTNDPSHFEDWNHLSSVGRDLFSKDFKLLFDNR